MYDFERMTSKAEAIHHKLTPMGIAPPPRIHQLRRREACAGRDPAQFEHAVADVPILCQVGGSNGFACGGHHLVERAAFGKFRVEFPAEFTRPAGACVEAADDGWISMFHERRLLGEASTDSPDLWDRDKIFCPRLIH